MSLGLPADPAQLLLRYAPHILILGGVAAASWLLERLVRPAPVVGRPVGWLVRLISYFGVFVGVLLMATAAAAWSGPAPALDLGTRWLLVVTGLALLLKPVRDVPWAALIGLAVGGLCAAFVILYLPLPGTLFGVPSRWIYLVAFLVPALVAYLLFKFLEDLLRLVAGVLASRPVSVILGLVCIAQGTLLLLDRSLFEIAEHGISALTCLLVTRGRL